MKYLDMDWNSMVLFLTTFDLYTNRADEIVAFIFDSSKESKSYTPLEYLVDTVERLLYGRSSILHIKIFINSGKSEWKY